MENHSREKKQYRQILHRNELDAMEEEEKRPVWMEYSEQSLEKRQTRLRGYQIRKGLTGHGRVCTQVMKTHS